MTSKRYGMLAADDWGVADERAPLVFLHGLSFDRGHWYPVMRELAAISPGRRLLALDLPGHGASPSMTAYDVPELAAVVHEAVATAGAGAPVMVGHSFSGRLATAYGARYPVRAVVNIDQPLRAEGFARMLRQNEPVLRGPDYASLWNSLRAGMRAESLPEPVQHLVTGAPVPPRELLLGYWRELLEEPIDELSGRVESELAAIRSAGIPYRYIAGEEPDPGYLAWLKAVLPGALVTVLPGSGHFPHLARPREVARLLAEDDSVLPLA